MQTSSRHFLLTLLLFDIVLLVGAVLHGYYDHHHHVLYHFKEGRLITFLSSFHLVAIALLSWIIYESERSEKNVDSKKNQSFIWLLIAMGFLFLAFDEVMKIHESIDFFVHDVFSIKETALSDRLDDLLVLLYVLVGAGLLYANRQTLLRFLPFVKSSMITGFILVGVMIVLDALTNRHDLITNDALHDLFSILEEVAKILAEYVFLMAVYRCWKRA